MYRMSCDDREPTSYVRTYMADPAGCAGSAGRPRDVLCRMQRACDSEAEVGFPVGSGQRQKARQQQRAGLEEGRQMEGARDGRKTIKGCHFA